MSDKLRKLILENPDLPIMVCCGEEANSGEWHYECHFDYRCEIVECTWFKERYFDDRQSLIDYILEEVMDYKTYNSFLNDEERKQWAENYIKENDIVFEKYIQIYVG